MAKSLFEGFKQGVKEGFEEVKNQTPEQRETEQQERQHARADKRQENEIKQLPTEISMLLGESEEVQYAFTFVNDKMVVTNRKIIHIDSRIAKSKTFAMIPFNKITSYSLLVPKGLSISGRLKIFTGGDVPGIEVETMFDDNLKEVCRILADLT